MSEGKCWWRYNNQGGRYKTCEINQYKKGKGKAPKEVSRITPEEFIEKIGKDYSDLSKAQKRNSMLQPDGLHRQFYVAVTRTIDNLYLIQAQDDYYRYVI